MGYIRRGLQFVFLRWYVNGRKISGVKVMSWALIGGVTVLAGLLAWVRSQTIGGTVGGALELLLIPFLVAYLVRGRKSKRNWNSFALWYFWLALSLLIIVAPGPSVRS